MKHLHLFLIPTLILLGASACSRNGEPAPPAEVAEPNAAPTIAKQKTAPAPVPPKALAPEGRNLTADQRIAAVSGEWILADYATAKAAWDKLVKDTAKKKVQATDDLEFVPGESTGRLEQELKRAASIGDKAVLKIAQGEYKLDVNFVAEGYERHNKGVIAWDTPYKGLIMSDPTFNSISLMTMMYHRDDLLLGRGVLPLPDFWCMKRRK